MATNVSTFPLVAFIFLGTLFFLKIHFHSFKIIPLCPHNHLPSPDLFLGRVHYSTRSTDQAQHYPLLLQHILGPHLHLKPSPSLNPVPVHSPNPILPLIRTRLQHPSPTSNPLQPQIFLYLQKIPHLQKQYLPLTPPILLLTP